jgi:hypothetical protein
MAGRKRAPVKQVHHRADTATGTTLKHMDDPQGHFINPVLKG